MKRIMFLLMIFLLLGSWCIVIANGQGKDDIYKLYINKAEYFLSEEIYIDAIEYYKKAIEVYPDNLENKLLLANIYKQAKMYNSFEKYCIDLSHEYKKNEEIICLLGDYYIEAGKDEKAIELYKFYLLEHKSSKIIASKLEELKSSFKTEYKTYTYISSFYNGYAIFKKEDKRGIMDDDGNEVIKAIYDYAEVFSNVDSLKLALVSKDGEFYYIDINGNKRRVADASDKSLYNDIEENTFSCGLAPVLVDGKWGYKDANEKIVISPQFNEARPFNNKGVAPVLKTEWQLIKLRLP
jgi:tetratricopeptide (TPR) repeat protein